MTFIKAPKSKVYHNSTCHRVKNLKVTIPTDGHGLTGAKCCVQKAGKVGKAKKAKVPSPTHDERNSFHALQNTTGVYGTEKGKTYHKTTCWRYKKYPMTELSHSEKAGRTPCKVCHKSITHTESVGRTKATPLTGGEEGNCFNALQNITGVYGTEKGKTYHKTTCWRYKKYPMTELSHLEKAGRTKCRTCFKF